MRQLDYDVVGDRPDAGNPLGGAHGIPFLAIAGGETVERHRPVLHQDTNVGDAYARLISELGEHIGFYLGIGFFCDRFHVDGSVFCPWLFD